MCARISEALRAKIYRVLEVGAVKHHAFAKAYRTMNSEELRISLLGFTSLEQFMHSIPEVQMTRDTFLLCEVYAQLYVTSVVGGTVVSS